MARFDASDDNWIWDDALLVQRKAKGHLLNPFWEGFVLGALCIIGATTLLLAGLYWWLA